MVLNIIHDFKNRVPANFNMFDINAKIKEKSPFIIVCL